MSPPSRPALRYHGGKWRLADWIIGHFPAHRIYVEAFGGGASVLLKKPRSYAEIYNDLDGEVVNLFRVMRDHGDELRNLIELTPYSRVEFLEAYVDVPEPVEQARRTLVKSFMGFGSAAVTQQSGTKPGAGFKADVDKNTTGFRPNSNQSGTSPANDWRNWSHRMPELIERLRGVCIENRDAVEVMQQQDSEETLFYVDPPYVHSTRGLAKHRTPQSYRHEMTDMQHQELAKHLHELKGMVLLSGYPGPLYDELYGDWQRIDKAGFANGDRERTECLWISPTVKDMQQGLLSL